MTQLLDLIFGPNYTECDCGAVSAIPYLFIDNENQGCKLYIKEINIGLLESRYQLTAQGLKYLTVNQNYYCQSV